MKPRAVLVFTPSTRRIFAANWSAVRASLDGLAVACELETTNVDELRAQLLRLQPAVVVAAGGDGTVNLCVGAMPRNTQLAVMPLGTANDFSRNLQQERKSRVDRLVVNGRAFCTTGGIGIPALVAERVNRLRLGRGESIYRAVGKTIYALTATKVVLEGAAPKRLIRVCWRDARSGLWRQARAEANTVFVANQCTFGGALRVTHDSVNDDGYFELCLLRHKSRLRDMVVMARIAAGRRQPQRDCRIVRASAARIVVDAPMPFFGDGEILDTACVFDIGIEAGGVSVSEHHPIRYPI